MKLTKKIVLLGLCAFFVCAGCSIHDTTSQRKESDRKFIELLDGKPSYNAKVTFAGKTAWVYLGIKNQLYYAKGSPKNQNPTISRPYVVEYLDGSFDEGAFILEYDIIPSIKTQTPNGLASSYGKEFSEANAYVDNAIAQSYLQSEDPPVFFVIVIADITNGVELIKTLCLDDIKKMWASALGADEYVLRIITETRGDTKIVNDTKGSYLKPYDISWNQFIAKQITHRVSFKYQSSDFSPGKDTQKEILSIISKTIRFYKFEEFDSFILRDIRENTEVVFDREFLERF